MYKYIKRLADIFSSLIVLIIFSPFFLIIAFLIVIDSRGGVFYKQLRVGKNGKEFYLFKFRSMKSGADKTGQLTIGNDARVTKIGKFIRKTKLDEIPQLINIIKGDMSVVGPRPEVPKYVAMYSPEQKKVLTIRPGLTDYASLEYFDEQKILGQSSDPENAYITEVMPKKIAMSLNYIQNSSFLVDLKLILQTIARIFK